MRLIAAAIDDGNVDEDEQREIEQAELQVKHGSQRGDVLDSFMSQKNRNSTTNFFTFDFCACIHSLPKYAQRSLRLKFPNAEVLK
jgi:hypothetical protein